jgi:hypothetical protein
MVRKTCLWQVFGHLQSCVGSTNLQFGCVNIFQSHLEDLFLARHFVVAALCNSEWERGKISLAFCLPTCMGVWCIMNTLECLRCGRGHQFLRHVATLLTRNIHNPASWDCRSNASKINRARELNAKRAAEEGKGSESVICLCAHVSNPHTALPHV